MKTTKAKTNTETKANEKTTSVEIARATRQTEDGKILNVKSLKVWEGYTKLLKSYFGEIEYKGNHMRAGEFIIDTLRVIKDPENPLTPPALFFGQGTTAHFAGLERQLNRYRSGYDAKNPICEIYQVYNAEENNGETKVELIQIGVITRKDIKSVKDVIKTLNSFSDLKGNFTDDEIKAVVTILIAEEIADYKTLINIVKNKDTAVNFFTELLTKWREKQENYTNVSNDFFNDEEDED